MDTLEFEESERRWRADLSRGYDISIPLRFDASQPRFFNAAPAHAEALHSGEFTGDVRLGASCNCSTYSLTPHCNGTHTECVGHITHERISIRDVAKHSLLFAKLITVEPVQVNQADFIITREAVRLAFEKSLEVPRAIVVRTTPNGADKLDRDYDKTAAAYFEVDAIAWLVEQGIEHIVTDVPSLDRGNDAGILAAHRVFWGMPLGATAIAEAVRPYATITELAYIADSIADGLYMLNLQIAPFATDASPSRPVLYAVEDA